MFTTLLYSKVDKYYGKTCCKYLTASLMWYNLKNFCVSIVQGSHRFAMQKLKTVNQKLEIQVPLVILPNNNIHLLTENSVEPN